MASISRERVQQLLARGGRALFTEVVEPMADAFDPALCDAYADLFSEVIASVIPALSAKDLAARYRRIRQPRHFEGDARRVFVLSRVTLGADVAITSLVLDAAKRRFPAAEIYFVATQKAWELFAADPRLRHVPVRYDRHATLHERLAIWTELRSALSDGIVIDPDSRLTQLGLLPICPEQNYYFFESRSYGADRPDTLPVLTKQWLSETLGVTVAQPFLAVSSDAGPADIAVSLGVGENPSKRVKDPFEEELLHILLERTGNILIDKGAGGEEAERVERAIARSGGTLERVRTWQGAFAPFAASIANSRLYVGYDSAGGHVAAACGVPLISIFAGAASPRFFDRWRPWGPGPNEVIRLAQPDPAAVLRQVQNALDNRLQI